MANVTIYTEDGLPGVKQLIASIVKSLTGVRNPIAGTAAPHMKLVYPADGSLDLEAPADWNDNTLVILESTIEIDPYADPAAGTLGVPVTPGTDPWRIAFHTSKWTGRSTYVPSTSGTGGTEEIDVIAENSLAVYVGTPSTLAINIDGSEATIGWASTNVQKLPYYLPGTVFSYRSTYKGRDLVEPLGNLGAEWTNTFDATDPTKKAPASTNAQSTSNDPQMYLSPAKWDGPDVTSADQLFINRYINSTTKARQFGGFAADSLYGQAISYRIVLTDHGMFLGCWGPDPEESGEGFSWVLIQRPVDKKTGIVRGINPLSGTPYTGAEVDVDGNLIPIGNRPLFCVNSVNGKFWKFVVREHDNPVPSKRKDAAANTIDSGAVINPYQQQSLTENGEYVITFLNNLNSSRFKYSDELDMLGTVSADVVGGGSQINVSVYSEEDKRAYHALWSSGSFGTRMRIMVVADVPTPNRPWQETEPLEESGPTGPTGP